MMFDNLGHEMKQEKEEREKKMVIDILSQFNDWRRGKPPYDEIGYEFNISPKGIGEAIDKAIEILQK